MHFACLITEVTNTHMEYGIHIASPQQQWLNECTSMLHCTYITHPLSEISIEIKRRKWNWIGYTLRKGNEAIEREALDWSSQGKRRRETLTDMEEIGSTMRH